jgi:DNA-binding NarL/FixJ family response regulator
MPTNSDTKVTDTAPLLRIAPARLWDKLSGRESEIARLLALGWRGRDIAELLRISQKTIDTHRGHAIKKLQCRNNADLARLAIREGVITAEEK